MKETTYSSKWVFYLFKSPGGVGQEEHKEIFLGAEISYSLYLEQQFLLQKGVLLGYTNSKSFTFSK